MVRLNRIYTRGGDKGKTSLGNGKRVNKYDTRIEAIGTLDEANAAIGLARLHTPPGEASAMLTRIQNDLFDLGADLCVPEGPDTGNRLRVTESQTKRLEEEIDRMNAALPPLNSFVLPGGTPAAAHLHFARAVVRNAERLICRLASRQTLNPVLLAYVNRLSDHLFVLARTLNETTQDGDLWAPGMTR